MTLLVLEDLDFFSFGVKNCSTYSRIHFSLSEREPSIQVKETLIKDLDILVKSSLLWSDHINPKLLDIMFNILQTLSEEMIIFGLLSIFP